MIAYKKEIFDNTILVDEAERLTNAGFINKQQLHFIESKLPVYHKHTNVFARLGLILLGFILYSACCSFLGVAITPWGENGNFSAFFLINAVAGFVVLELVLIRNLKYYGNGLDDAFLICAQANLISFIAFLHRDTDHLTDIFIATALIGVICCLRYADRFSALLTCFGITGLVIYLCLTSGSAGKMILPFVCMLVAAGIYGLYRLIKKGFEITYYAKSLEMCFAYSCLLFYLSGNYLVVRELSELLLGDRIMPGADIPFASFFYALTFLTPLAFIVFGLIRKRRDLLWIGLITLVFSIFSIRYYYHVIPTELALIFGGLAVFGIAFFAMRRLKDKTTGLTSEQDHRSISKELLAAESLWLIENYHSTATSSHSGAEPGGGQFGGAGSSGNF